MEITSMFRSVVTCQDKLSLPSEYYVVDVN